MRNLDRIGKPIVLKPKRIQLATPCADELTTVLNCWRSLGVDASSCAEVSKSLMACMAKRGKVTAKKPNDSVSEINKWLAEIRKNKTL